MNPLQRCSLLRISFGLVFLAALGAFAGGYPRGAAYAATLATTPNGRTCPVMNGAGTAGASLVTTIVVSCATLYTVGGTIAGLGDETGLVLLNNGIDATNIPAGSSTFLINAAIASGSAYAITIKSHPPGTHCVISGGTGIVSTSNVTDVRVSCGAPAEVVLDLLSYTEGTSPWGSLLFASDGNFYAMATNYGLLGFGAVLKVTSTSVVTVLYSFAGGSTDGANPYGSLIEATDGNFYGMTSAGGASDKGVVIRITPAGTGTILHSFAGGAADGDTPLGSLIQGSDGYLYGMTEVGGTTNNGTVFKMDLAGVETVLYSFGASPDDGVIPTEAALVEGTDGNFYGTASGGGALGYGAIFSITPAGIETVLHSFSLAEGANPESSLTQARDGSFWGATVSGGAGGKGTVFKVTSTGALTVMHSFLGPPTDGTYGQGGLIQASDSHFYGMTYLGGASNNGAVYRITPTGVESLLYSFAGSADADGAWASGSLVEGGNGDLYGMTSGGGTNLGTVFRLY